MECPVCCETFEPGFTCSRCNNSICEQCFIKMVKQAVETNTTFKCPLCRHEETVAVEQPIVLRAPVIQVLNEFPIMYQNRDPIPDIIQGGILSCCTLGCMVWAVVWCTNFIGY